MPEFDPVRFELEWTFCAADEFYVYVPVCAKFFLVIKRSNFDVELYVMT